jgi:tetratricopeptide (TPR) repeat protein
MASRLTAPLREAPATVPALAAVVLFVVWAMSQAGYPMTHWAPGGLIVLALLLIALNVVGLRWRQVPTPVKIALAALAGYTALSFLSILWADVPGEAWEGANRTLLYLLVFALFACWPQRGASAALLLCAWVLALIALAAYALLHADAATPASLQTLFSGGRLEYPTGYPNASAAQWLMAFWPAVLLARSERLPWALRGLLAGGAVLLADVALLSQSRGALYATPVMLVLVFAVVPARARTFTLLVPVLAGIAATAPRVLAVGDHLHAGAVTSANIHSATVAVSLAAVSVALLVALAAALESRSNLSAQTRRRVGRGVGAIALATLLAVLVAGLALAGNPVSRVRHGWDTFKGGYAANSASGNRLTSGLGSNRYDFYRVALDEFRAHPLFGIGADNFQQQYLAHGRSDETPRYPHSVELRTLSQAGVLGAALALLGLLAALLAAARPLRDADPLVRSVSAAALAGFAYWLVHGSFDWFWEFAGLGAPAFALLGLGCALAPARLATGEPRAVPEASRRRPLALIVGGVAAVAVAASLIAPWLSQLQIESAVRVWTTAPQTAYARLSDAARLNPLSDAADLAAGGIALRYNDLTRADRDFSAALERDRGDAYATLERGAIASSRGERATAQTLLERAEHLNPRDELTRSALAVVRAGRRVDVAALNRLILLKAQQLA